MKAAHNMQAAAGAHHPQALHHNICSPIIQQTYRSQSALLLLLPPSSLANTSSSTHAYTRIQAEYVIPPTMRVYPVTYACTYHMPVYTLNH
jgi:hypothetical protein